MGDLTSRLEQTNERMKKLSTTLSSSVVEREEEEEEEEVVVVSARDSVPAYPLTRTTRIKVVDPLDGVIQSMIQTPDTGAEPGAQEHCPSSTDSSPLMYRAVVVLQDPETESDS